MRRRAAVLLVTVGLVMAGCGAKDGPDPAPNLFGEYTKSISVINDRFPSTGGSSEDRLANFAAHYSVEQLQTTVLSAFPCETGTEQGNSGGYFDTHCDLNSAVKDAVRQVGGSADKVSGRAVLVKHDDALLELVTLYVAEGKVIDRNGQIYTGLDEFRAKNELLSSKDLMLAPSNLTAIPGEGAVVTVYGHTRATWPLWLLGGAGGVLLLAVLLVVLLRIRSRRAA